MDQTGQLAALTATTTGGAKSASTSAPAQSPEQLRVLAAQFEAMLMGQMLKQMQSAMFGDDDDSDSGFARGPLADAMYSELSQSLSRSGGFGLAESMMGPLLRQTGADGGGMTGQFGPLAALGVGTIDVPSFSLSETAAATGFSMPSPVSLGPISSKFGWRQDPFAQAMKFHKGTDIAMPMGQDVPVAQAGKVTFAGEQAGYGLTVTVEHAPGLSTRYAHLSEVSVEVGEPLTIGQTIGKSGATGRTTGPHLHFEVIEGGHPVDPAAGLARLGLSVKQTD